MPKGPKGERRPADVIGNDVEVMRISTGEDEDVATPPVQRRRWVKQAGLQGRAI